MKICTEVVRRSFDFAQWKPVNKWIRKYYLAADLSSPILEEEIAPSPSEEGVRRYTDAAIVATSDVELLSSRKGDRPYSGWNEGERVYALLDVGGKHIPVQLTRWVGKGAFSGVSLTARPSTESSLLQPGRKVPAWVERL